MDYLNVKDYGAVGVDTPSADDTAAIQQAINNSVSENKPLYFPPGYCLSPLNGWTNLSKQFSPTTFRNHE